MRIIKYFFFCFLITSASPAFSTIFLETLMSTGEKKKTGYEKLTEREKANLDIWINANFSQNSIIKDASVYLSVNVKSGTELILSDDSRWAVDPRDQHISSIWITSFPLKVTLRGSEEYPYILTNLNTLKTVKAKPISP